MLRSLRCFARRRRHRLGWCAVFALALSSPATAEAITILVGSDGVCDVANVQAAVNMAANNVGPDTIRVAMNQTYTAQAIKAGGHDLTIEGGYVNCSSTTPAPNSRTTLSGLGGAADTVIEFSGSANRVLRDLIVTRGDDPVSGGGIQSSGAGELLLDNVIVSLNEAPLGAGINVHGPFATSANLVFGAGTVVQSNTASLSGGGVRLTGNSRLFMKSPDTAIIGNAAQGNAASNEGFGGGLLVVPPARAVIASAGAGAQAAIDDNQARVGGGIAVRAPADGSGSGHVVLYTTDMNRPVRVANNRASELAGGIFVSSSPDMEADVCLYEFRLHDNRAPAGAAIATRGADLAPGGIHMNTQACGVTAIPPEPDGVLCQPHAHCNEVVDNRSLTGAGIPTAGAIIEIGKDHNLGARRTAFRRNVGGTLLYLDVDASLLMRNSLLVDNESSDSLVVMVRSLSITDRAEMIGVTIAGNDIAGSSVLSISARFQNFWRMIVDQPGIVVLDPHGFTPNLDGVLVSDCALLECSDAVLSTPAGPRFVDPEDGDYRLHASSRAVDTSFVLGSVDIDNVPRDIDLVRVPDRGGISDLGAYERQSTAPLVRNGTFVTDARLWQVPMPGSATFVGPGDVRVHDDPNLTFNEVVGMRQCVPLPGPGAYALAALAYGEGLLALSRDRPVLRWRLYGADSSSDCVGTPVAAGEVFFSVGTAGFFQGAIEPATFEVSPAAFGENSQVEILLVAMEGSQSVNSPTAAHFTDVVLEPIGALDELFADGFE